MAKQILLGASLQELQDLITHLELPKYTAKQLLDWIYIKRCDSFDLMSNLSKTTRAVLSEHCVVGFSKPIKVQTSVDGTKKYLFKTTSGFVETAFIPDHERATLCVSCQVGCQMNCKFCSTGKQGFQGNLTAGDILNQIFSVPEYEQLTNYVFMGMGEPMNNYDAIMRTLDVMTSPWGLAMSPTRITVSTVGIIPQMKRFITESKANLAISLHSPFHDERASIMPAEKSFPIREVIHAVRQFDWSGQRRLSFEYIVIKGLNDTAEHIKELAKQLGSLRCRVNLIRWHAVPEVALESPSLNDMTRFRDALNNKGIIATIRASRGQDIDAACGLLSTSSQSACDDESKA